MVRRGATTLMYETVISLVLLGLFSYSLFNYISSHTNGEDYFSKFYSTDIATSADLVNAGYGDVVLRYDNLKPSLDIAFWLKNGQVAVGKPVTQLEIIPTTARIAYYGQAESYPDGPTTLRKPAFLVLRKNNGNFAISEAETSLRACPAVAEKLVPADKAVIYLGIEGGDEMSIRKIVQATLPMKYTEKQEDANIVILLKKSNGGRNEIDFGSTNLDGKAFDCLFKERLRALTLVDFAANEPQALEQKFIVHIDLKAKDQLSNEQIGQALANALAVYYR